MQPKALYVKGVGRVPVDSQLEVIHREKASFTEGLGWSYRFKSGEDWFLIALDQVVVFVYDQAPEATTVGSNKGSAVQRGSPEQPSPSWTARYADELV